ncbi:bacteriohemerythrin [Arcobacter sp. YIC-464]|uniref:bacteriohemerythrin n=1 Tax=Arcobacter sp. YIC-464 TaxID=3376631 RepID=UPI003C1C5BE6
MNFEMDLEQLVWKSEYNIGNLQIDKEHQQLFDIARKAFNINKLQDEKTKLLELKKVVTELFEYVGNHFNDEQKFMERIKYPHLDEHKTLHTKMIDKLKTLIKDFNSLEIKEIEKELFVFIDNYFVKHIILEDKKIQLWQTPLDELRKNFGWKHIYSVNNSKIDQEHKQLFDIAKEAFKPVDEKERTKKVKNILIELYDYMKTHFNDEEEYMQQIQYPELEKHKKIHKEIIKELNSFVQKLPQLKTEVFEKELAIIIDLTLVQHIIQEDRKIIRWQQSKV